GEPLALLSFATLTPRKGHEMLMRALAPLADRRWRLRCAGSIERDAATVDSVRGLIRDLGLADRVALLGDLDATSLAAEYDRADLFVLPTRHEGYGMAVAEALARGLPVVSTNTGGIADLVNGTADGAGPGVSAGLVTPPGDLRSFAEALRRAIDD